jgi:site-specific DNA recombinase
MISQVAVYCRRSRDQSGQAISVGVQEKQGRKYAERRWPGVPVEAFVDNDLSGADPTVVRPDYQRMLEAVRAGRIVHVVTREQARLTRQPSEWEELCVALQRAGIDEIHTVSGGIVSVAKASRLVGRLIAVVDAEEAERASVRVRLAAQAGAEEGRPAGHRHRRPAGSRTQWSRPALVPHPEQAPVVRRIVSAVADGKSLGSIAGELDADGIPTPRDGLRWHRESLRLLATSPRVIGQRTHQGKVIGPAQWPAIVDLATWERAGARLATSSVTSITGGIRFAGRSRATSRRYLLTGLALCAACDTPLIASQQHRRTEPRLVRAYSCPHPSLPNGGCGGVSATAEHVDAEVLSRLRTAADAGLISKPTASPDGHEAWAAQLTAAEGRLGHLAHEWGAGAILELEWRAARAAAVAQIDEARMQLARIAAPTRIADPVELIGRWAVLPLALQRDLLVQVTERITIGKRTVTGGPRWDARRVTIDWRT